MTQVVLLGFGGPETPQEVRPFLDRIAQGRPIPPERLESVAKNYEAIGGSSPFNALTRAQAAALQNELTRRGVDVPVRVAYRFAAPFIEDVARAAREAQEPSIAVILAAHQSDASWKKYVDVFPDATFTAPFFAADGFIQAHVERIKDALHVLQRGDFSQTGLVFTAHSIPVAMAKRDPYVEQLNTSARLVSERLGAPRYTLAYTSRSGSPSDPWLEPDVRDLLSDLAARGTKEAVIDPLGFVCDHVEVLYDLDVDAASVAESLGIRIARARALNDHPAFVAALADAVQACFV